MTPRRNICSCSVWVATDIPSAHGVVHDAQGRPLPGAKVEVWHCDTRGFYSHFDPTGQQAPFNMRRTIYADENGRYKFQSILPSGYGVPPGSPPSSSPT